MKGTPYRPLKGRGPAARANVSSRFRNNRSPSYTRVQLNHSPGAHIM